MNFLKIEDVKNYRVVSLNRPEVKNAFHPEMIAEITKVFTDLNNDQKIHFVVLDGLGTAFCAGADLNWMKDMVNYSFEQNIQDSEKLWQMFQAIAFCSVPLVGVVHGAVFGGALGLVACCDYVFAEEKTQFCFSEVKLGLAPAVISSFVTRKIADGFARSLMISGDFFNAEKATQAGLVHCTFAGAFDANSLKPFISNGTEAMRETKKLLNHIPQANWAEQKNLTTTVIAQRRMSAEAQERLKKFVEKK